MQRKPGSFPEAQIKNVLAKLKNCRNLFKFFLYFLGEQAQKSPEQFMIDMLRHLDPKNQGCVSFEQLSKGLKEYLMKKIIDNYQDAD